MDRIADNEQIQLMIDNDELITCRRQDGAELQFKMCYRQRGQLAALLNTDNQQEGSKWLVYDSKGNLIKAPEIEKHEVHYW